MITQDSLRFYKDHAVYPQFGGVVLDREEGKRIAKCLGNGKAAILQNHGLLTVGPTIDAAAFWFISLDKTCKKPLSATRQLGKLQMLTTSQVTHNFWSMQRSKGVGIRRLLFQKKRPSLVSSRSGRQRKDGLRSSHIWTKS